MKDKIEQARRKARFQAAAKILLTAAGYKGNVSSYAADLKEQEVLILLEDLSKTKNKALRFAVQRAQKELERISQPADELLTKQREWQNDRQKANLARSRPVEERFLHSVPNGIYCVGSDDKACCVETFPAADFGHYLDIFGQIKPTLWQRITGLFKKEVYMELDQSLFSQYKNWKRFIIRFKNETAKELFCKQNADSGFIDILHVSAKFSNEITASIRPNALKELMKLNPDAEFLPWSAPILDREYHGISGQRDI